jgi:hypothetical protein
MAVIMRNVIFGDMAPCSVSPPFQGRRNNANVSNHLTLPYLRYFLCSEDGSDMSVRNAGFYKTHTAPHPRRRHSFKYSIVTRTHYVQRMCVCVCICGLFSVAVSIPDCTVLSVHVSPSAMTAVYVRIKSMVNNVV